MPTPQSGESTSHSGGGVFLRPPLGPYFFVWSRPASYALLGPAHTLTHTHIFSTICINRLSWAFFVDSPSAAVWPVRFSLRVQCWRHLALAKGALYKGVLPSMASELYGLSDRLFVSDETLSVTYGKYRGHCYRFLTTVFSNMARGNDSNLSHKFLMQLLELSLEMRRCYYNG